MPEPTFRGDPYRVLDVPRGASAEELKRRWRELAREHHPDRAVDDPPEQQRLTARMARINSAYDLLRDPVRRARYDASPSAQRAWDDGSAGPTGRAAAAGWADDGSRRPTGGPPPPPPSRPVTARFDTTTAFRHRDTITGTGSSPLRGQDPRPRSIDGAPDLRASTPTGPVRRRSTRQAHCADPGARRARVPWSSADSMARPWARSPTGSPPTSIGSPAPSPAIATW